MTLSGYYMEFSLFRFSQLRAMASMDWDLDQINIGIQS
jgi:hypothetical protein